MLEGTLGNEMTVMHIMQVEPDPLCVYMYAQWENLVGLYHLSVTESN